MAVTLNYIAIHVVLTVPRHCMVIAALPSELAVEGSTCGIIAAAINVASR